MWQIEAVRANGAASAGLPCRIVPSRATTFAMHSTGMSLKFTTALRNVWNDVRPISYALTKSISSIESKLRLSCLLETSCGWQLLSCNQSVQHNSAKVLLRIQMTNDLRPSMRNFIPVLEELKAQGLSGAMCLHGSNVNSCVVVVCMLTSIEANSVSSFFQIIQPFFCSRFRIDFWKISSRWFQRRIPVRENWAACAQRRSAFEDQAGRRVSDPVSRGAIAVAVALLDSKQNRPPTRMVTCQ